MNKRYLHHLRTRMRPLSPWYFLIGCVFFAGLGVVNLRQNNLTAIQLRDEVVKTDEMNGDVEAALRELREFVYAHMNTDLGSGPNAIRPPIQLKYRYERLVGAEKERVSQANEKVYTQAQAECERRIPSGTIASRIPCVQEYVSVNSIKENPIPDSLYKFDFASPIWSPDTAGWNLVLSAVLLVLFITRLVLDRWLRVTLHRHQ